MTRMRDKRFMPNNIELREISSMCLSQYKSAQAKALGELQKKSAHTFSKTAKEVLLLKYDIWFRWLLEAEVLLRMDVKNVAEVLVHVSDRLEGEYTAVLTQHDEVFNQKFVSIWLETHSYVYNYLRKKITLLSQENLSKFMIGVTEVLINVMDNTLSELHEIDNLFNGGEIFVSFDDICYDYSKICTTTNPCLLVARLHTYKKYFDFDENNILVKDYSQEEKILKSGGKRLKEKFLVANYKISKIV